jgi:hypothetical protein
VKTVKCKERDQLQRSYHRAEKLADTARERLRKKMGTSSREEFRTLQLAAEQAERELKDARRSLDQHIREHHCKAANAVSVRD